MRVEITEPAEQFLMEIYQFIKTTSSEEKADTIAHKILDHAEALAHFPNRGQIEAHLKSLGKGHRYIIVDKYKIIYLVQEPVIYITDIFDSRQDPGKLSKRNK
ncbi:MAG: type II toxin-antitoxin system RelE/ParE family toxin [Flammeovirgaceae bacterium]|nr:type II toxin-antitoxin system RelE/ParE family toxin [Flammeovirgaceae bacterium]